MDLNQGEGSEARFAAYVAGVGSVIGQAVRMRMRPLRDYCTGLMPPGERKSVEPMAARTAAQHQSLLHFVGNADWSDEAVLAKVCEMVQPAIGKSGPAKCLSEDDLALLMQKHSCSRDDAVKGTGCIGCLLMILRQRYVCFENFVIVSWLDSHFCPLNPIASSCNQW
jgi:hypothetical protein